LSHVDELARSGAPHIVASRFLRRDAAATRKNFKANQRISSGADRAPRGPDCLEAVQSVTTTDKENTT